MDLLVYLFIVCVCSFGLYAFYGLIAYCKYNNYKNSSDNKVQKVFYSQMTFDSYCSTVYKPSVILTIIEKRWYTLKSINDLRKRIKYMNFICSKISVEFQEIEKGA